MSILAVNEDRRSCIYSHKKKVGNADARFVTIDIPISGHSRFGQWAFSFRKQHTLAGNHRSGCIQEPGFDLLKVTSLSQNCPQPSTNSGIQSYQHLLQLYFIGPSNFYTIYFDSSIQSSQVPHIFQKPAQSQSQALSVLISHVILAGATGI